MAIVVEEEQRKSHMFAVAGWLVFLAIIGTAVYYIFFAPPPESPVQAASGLNAIATLTQSPVQPKTIENSSALSSLHSNIAAPATTTPASVGRPNPFIAP